MEITKVTNSLHKEDLDKWVITKVLSNGAFELTLRCEDDNDCPEGYYCYKGIMKKTQ